MTVAGALAAAAAALAGRDDLPDPGREARFLLARAFGRPEAWLLAHPEAEVESGIQGRFDGWVARRANGEPAHYIVGSCPFWGREFLVTPAVLIPRPETELIVERALAERLPARPRLLDVGAGSGCLSVTLAVELRPSVVVATDRSPAALSVARRNAARHGARVALACGDLAAHVAGRFDLVVANLPYVPEGQIATLPRDVRDFEPRAALLGGADGADLVRGLIADLPRLLAPGGLALLEVGPGQAALLAPDIATAGLAAESALVDVGGVERTLVLRHLDRRL